MRGTAIAIVFVAASCARPNRAEFASSWQKAVATKDGRAMLALVDGTTQAKLRAAAEKTRAAAVKDADVRKLVAQLGADATAPPDVLAGAMLAASGDPIADHGTTALHLEDGRWRATLAPYGFSTSDGAPLHAHVRLASDAAPVPALAHTSFQIHVDFNGLTEDEVMKRHHEALVTIAKEAGLSPGWLADADVIVAFYAQKLGTDEVSSDVSFDVGADGSITATLKSFDRNLLREVAHRTALRYGDF
jgi:hypothetical protein